VPTSLIEQHENAPFPQKEAKLTPVTFAELTVTDLLEGM
jgi:hypothetical protein